MKVEVIDLSTLKTIETYFVSDLSILDFQEWKDESKVEIHLNCLLNTVKNLNSKDSETQDPISNPTEVDFYLPAPLMNNVLVQLAKSQTDTAESPNQFEDRLNEVTDRVSTPELKSSIILSAVV